MFSLRFPCSVATVKYSSQNTFFGIINCHFYCKIVIESFFVLEFRRKFSQKWLGEKKSLLIEAFKSTLKNERIKLCF